MGFFLAIGQILGWNSRQNLKIIDLNQFLSLEIDCFQLSIRKIINFYPNVWKVGVDHCANLIYFHSSCVYPYPIKPCWVFTLCTGSQMYVAHVSIKTWNLTFLRLPAIFRSTKKLRFPLYITFSWSASHMRTIFSVTHWILPGTLDPLKKLALLRLWVLCDYWYSNICVWMLKSHSEWRFLELQRKDDECYW